MDASLTSTCLFCGSTGEGGAACPSCSMTLPADGDEPSLEKATCPRCQGEATLGARDKTIARACGTCHGIFAPPKAWARLLAEPDDAKAIDAEKPAAPPSLLPFVSCPVCTFEMERVRFASASSVVIDVCQHRHGVWLDAGELSAITEFLRLRAEVGEDKLRDEAAKQDEKAEQVVREATLLATGVAPPVAASAVDPPTAKDIVAAGATPATKNQKLASEPLSKIGVGVFLALTLFGILIARGCEKDVKVDPSKPGGASSNGVNETTVHE